jgi:hypothetical protein
MQPGRIYIKIGILAIVISSLAIIFKNVNPETSVLFPKCPFKLLTGLDCPGCGSQRTIHYLLNLKIDKAVQTNVLLVCGIPYIIIGYLFDLNHVRNQYLLNLRKRFYGEKAIWVIIIVIILFWILRNVF